VLYQSAWPDPDTIVRSVSFDVSWGNMRNQVARDLADKQPSTRKEEGRSFAFLAVVMAPVLAVLIVASYGFAVWFYQMLAGPPGS
jgi:nitrate reductase NapE